MPDELSLNRRIERKRQLRRRRVAEVNAIAERGTRKANLQTHCLLSTRSFHFVFALANAACNRLRASPQCRCQPAFASERTDDGVESCIG